MSVEDERALELSRKRLAACDKLYEISCRISHLSPDVSLACVLASITEDVIKAENEYEAGMESTDALRSLSVPKQLEKLSLSERSSYIDGEKRALLCLIKNRFKGNILPRAGLFLRDATNRMLVLENLQNYGREMFSDEENGCHREGESIRESERRREEDENDEEGLQWV